MGEKNVSVVFKARDRLSESIREMRDSVKGLRADVQDYGKTKDRILEEKTQVQLETKKARDNLRELSKEVKKGAEGADEAWRAQQKEIELLSERYRDLTQQQKEAAKAEKDLHSTMQKTSNAGGMSGMLGSLAKAGLGSMLGDAMGNLAGSVANSIFGAGSGSAVGSIGSNALSGAAIGSIVPGIGTAIGAAVGGLTGAIQALTDRQAQMDSLYQQEVQALYEDSISETEGSIQNGSAIAATRESYREGFASALGEDAGRALYAEIKKYGDTTAYDTTEMLSKGREMLAYGIAGENVMELMEILGDIAGGNTTNFSGLSYAISQSMAAGKLNAQDKNQMVGYGFNPLEFVAKEQGVSVAEATEMMSDGKISSEMLMDALRLAVSEGERFYNGIDALSNTYDSLTGQLESAWSDLEAAAGEGYNEKRKEGIAAELAAMEEMSDSLQNAYEMVGTYEAELENQHQQSIINAMEDAAKRIEEEGLSGIEAEKAMWEAKTQAEIDYKNSEEYQMKLAAEKSLVERIQASLSESGEYVQFGYEMAQQFTKGWNSGRLNSAEGLTGFTAAFAGSYHETNGYATGLQRVP